ncbi:N-acetylmannosamine-6-phosphate 2-epimerase [Streptomyces parvus]|uniref:Putative N-acetylmannosamine-6-phosphate 2-epimerase n=1 Tax=Streptomyces parvus TaxID=66428 RepID=A0A5D4IHX6_9ACTN|nr:N-acetylmannosamine-6-phosphate 2-epimerase [Streptomyces parvus]TYR51735.1 N-acetylmannosamine-6-phosphate 2-epimerase [Streptomyces parvus]
MPDTAIGTTTVTGAGPTTTVTTERDLVPPTRTSRAPRPARAAAVLRGLAGSLIVSCQALPGEPLHGPDIMARMARAAVAGGAAAVRINSLDDVAAVRQAVTVPLIGLWKDGDDGVYITPTLGHARRIAEAGADLVAIDATGRPRRDGLSLPHTIAALHRLGIGVLADVSTHEEGLAAAAANADAVATTLSGYTPDSAPPDGPDFTLVTSLAAALDVPLIAEGRITTPAEAARALALGAHAVVVGGAITRPTAITERFAAALGPASAAPTPSVPSPVIRRTAEEPTA